VAHPVGRGSESPHNADQIFCLRIWTDGIKTAHGCDGIIMEHLCAETFNSKQTNTVAQTRKSRSANKILRFEPPHSETLAMSLPSDF